jgi:hypothetical protein
MGIVFAVMSAIRLYTSAVFGGIGVPAHDMGVCEQLVTDKATSTVAIPKAFPVQ